MYSRRSPFAPFESTKREEDNNNNSHNSSSNTPNNCERKQLNRKEKLTPTHFFGESYFFLNLFIYMFRSFNMKFI